MLAQGASPGIERPSPTALRFPLSHGERAGVRGMLSEPTACAGAKLCRSSGASFRPSNVVKRNLR